MADSIGLGVVVKVNDGSSGAQAELLYCIGITPPAPEVEHADASYLNQGNRIRTTKPVMTQPGTCQLTFKRDPTERARFVTLQSLTLNQTCPIFQIVWSDATHQFSAWVVKIQDNLVGIGDFNTYTVDLKVNSLITVS